MSSNQLSAWRGGRKEAGKRAQTPENSVKLDGARLRVPQPLRMSRVSHGQAEDGRSVGGRRILANTVRGGSSPAGVAGGEKAAKPRGEGVDARRCTKTATHEHSPVVRVPSFGRAISFSLTTRTDGVWKRKAVRIADGVDALMSEELGAQT